MAFIEKFFHSHLKYDISLVNISFQEILYNSKKEFDKCRYYTFQRIVLSYFRKTVISSSYKIIIKRSNK